MSERYNASLRELEEEWSLLDLLHAHLMLNAFDEARRDAEVQRRH